MLKIGEFSKRSGVTVKTLLHYDKIGLLKPSQKTDAGYRVYCDEDFLKLQQIVTLKFIGLSLDEIKQLLFENGGNVDNIIHIQKKALVEKKKHIESVITVMDKAEKQIKENGFSEVDELIDIIKKTNMEVKVNEQYKTAENFNIRSKLRSYNTNKTDWTNWCFNEMQFPNDARILELGCGTGDLWYKNADNMNDNWSITLSDSSKGMLQSTRRSLKKINHKFTYKDIDAQHIPYEDESFDVVIARHMLCYVPDIEKALCEIKRVLVNGGVFYATTTSRDDMAELNEIVEKFDIKLGINHHGMCYRFDNKSAQALLNKYFREAQMKVLQGEIEVQDAEPIVNYKASTITGSSILTGEKKQQFTEYINEYIKKKGSISTTTKACMFKVKK